jgi:hypothetical protein
MYKYPFFPQLFLNSPSGSSGFIMATFDEQHYAVDLVAGGDWAELFASRLNRTET